MANGSTATSPDVSALQRLAAVLHEKTKNPISRRIVAVIGAGASTPAGFPLASELKAEFHRRFLNHAEDDAAIYKLFEREIKHFWVAMGGNRDDGTNRILTEITPFDLASALSSTEYGRGVIRDAIRTRLSRPTCRPLAYELLAHLAKHRYLDHFIVLNYDDLLDEAIDDELHERFHRVASAVDIPANRVGDRKDRCFVVHPFGVLGEGPYSITPGEISEFARPIRDFIAHSILGSDPGIPLTLILVGYAAAEPAFAKLLHSQTSQNRSIGVFAIDTAPELPPTLQRAERNLSVTVHHVSASADDGLEILLSLLNRYWTHDRFPVWIPGARHKLVAKCGGRAVLEPEKRFRLEILLQGTKSRGFVHLEAFSQIHRFKKYSMNHAQEVLDGLLESQVLLRDEWLPDRPEDPTEKGHRFVPNYMLAEKRKVAEEILRTCSRAPGEQVDEWHVELDGDAARVTKKSTNLGTYVERLLDRIEVAPDIEVVSNAAPEAGWMLGANKTEITSMRELAAVTSTLLDTALDYGDRIQICGIWATGEWLFGREGWAADQRDALLARIARGEGPIDLKLVVSRAGGLTGRRAEQRAHVLSRLWTAQEHAKKGSSVELKWDNWWEMNRVLTLVRYGHRTEAIYMRRRLGRPVVSPYHVDGEPGAGYLREVWERYWKRAAPVTQRDVESLRQTYSLKA